MSTLFTWNQKFLTHLDFIDNQHLRLVKLINDLGEMVTSVHDTSPTDLARIRDQIYDYTQTHFSDEEALMVQEKLDPRFIEQHHKAHEQFIAEALNLSKKDSELLSAQAKQLAESLVHWLAYHILGIDQSMARQINAIRQGTSPEQAYDNEQKQNTDHEPLLEAMSGLFYVVTQRNRELRELNQTLESRIKQRTLQIEEANAKLETLASHDELTGLPNRRYAMLTLERLWLEYKRYGHVFSVLILDADYFKAVNDGFGHAQGDSLLKALSQRLTQQVRDSDLVCRMGGDEFLVICNHCGLEGAQAVAHKIMSSARPLTTPTGIQCWDGSVSIGVAETTDETTSIDDLLHTADSNMYIAKKQKKSGQ